ncbi:MAG: TonB-dependent receptor [Proteobacteria bacterium]|nr:TonB-dependent receptor [Pseudomonadota bacterium]
MIQIRSHIRLLLGIALCGSSFGIPALASAAAAGAATAEGELTEVVVTAEKRESTVQKTPISMTAISGEALAAQGAVSLLDVAQETPGVSFRTSGPGQTEFEVRGLSSSGGATATVGYYLDDIPISPPALGDIGKVVIDPNLYDLNRVEVLRGPQGTLYGAGSMGGTIKLITNPAKLNVWESAADASLSSTTRNGGTNWGVNAMLNAPLATGRASFRLTVSSAYTDGWIDRIVVNPFPFPTNNGCTPTTFQGCARGNVAAGPFNKIIPRTNHSQMDSARLNLLLRPTDELKITLMSMYERTQTGGYSTFDVPPGPSGILAHYQPFDTREPTSDYVRLSNLNITYDFSNSQLTSSTSYWNRSLQQFQELSEGFQNLYFSPAFYPNEGTLETDDIEQFSEELRLASGGRGPFQWLVGGFYSSLRTAWDQSSIDPVLTDYVYSTGLYAPVTSADNPNGYIYVGHIPYNMKQYAAFSELSYQFTPAWKASVGARYYKYDTEVHASQAGIFTQSVSAVPTIVRSSTSANGFNPKVNLAYTPSDDLTVYGTIAKGFRPGGVNLPLPAAGPNSCTAALAAIGANSQTISYGADSVWSYELGEKARLANGRVTLNSALYYIRWNDIQQLVPLACGYFFTVNAGQARSYGSEVELSANLTRDWSISLSGGYTNAEINSPNPTLGIAPGTPVLNIPKYTASGSINYGHQLGANLKLTARVAATYMGALTDESFTYVNLPGYTLVDARIGLVADHWTAYLSATNLTNKIAELTANNMSLTFNQPDLTRVSTNQPRTIGVNVGVRF